MNAIVELLVCLQGDGRCHRDLGVNDVGYESLNDLVAAADEALLEVYHVEEQDVEAGGEDCCHVCEPVPEDYVEIVLRNELIQ